MREIDEKRVGGRVILTISDLDTSARSWTAGEMPLSQGGTSGVIDFSVGREGLLSSIRHPRRGSSRRLVSRGHSQRRCLSTHGGNRGALAICQAPTVLHPASSRRGEAVSVHAATSRRTHRRTHRTHQANTSKSAAEPRRCALRSRESARISLKPNDRPKNDRPRRDRSLPVTLPATTIEMFADLDSHQATVPSS